MTAPKEITSEERDPDNFTRFIRLLKDVAAVPKSAIYELDPKLRPLPRPISSEKKDAE
jgi:hypothetical protein